MKRVEGLTRAGVLQANQLRTHSRPMARPRSFTIIAIVMAWLAIAGFGWAFAAPHVPAEQFHALGLHPPTLIGLGIAYGVAAAMVAVGLWRVATWTPRAILLWAVTLLASLVALPLMKREIVSPWWVAVLGGVIFAGIVFVLHRHVYRTVTDHRAAI